MIIIVPSNHLKIKTIIKTWLNLHASYISANEYQYKHQNRDLTRIKPGDMLKDQYIPSMLAEIIVRG